MVRRDPELVWGSAQLLLDGLADRHRARGVRPVCRRERDRVLPGYVLRMLQSWRSDHHLVACAWAPARVNVGEALHGRGAGRCRVAGCWSKQSRSLTGTRAGTGPILASVEPPGLPLRGFCGQSRPKWPWSSQMMHRSGSRQSLRRWSLLRQRKHFPLNLLKNASRPGWRPG